MIEFEPPHINDLSHVYGNNDDDIVPNSPNNINFLVYNSNSNGDVCSIGCEGDYGEIFDTLKRLWKEERKEYELFFMVQDRYAIAAGVIFQHFPDRVKELKRDYPDVDTLILVDVPGSADDNAMTEGSPLVHKYGYQTCVPSNGHVSSGGTDLFVSGVRRYATPGAKIGIHSWEDKQNGKWIDGNDLPKDHPSHDMYLDFYASVCIPEDFYWETLSHGVNPMYYIKAKEMKEDGKFHYMRDCTAAKCNINVCKDDPDFRKRKGGCKKFLERKRKKKCRREKVAKACPNLCNPKKCVR